MNEDLYNIINTNLLLCKMSGGSPRAHYIRSDSNDTNYDTSSVQLLLDTESQKNTKHRKVLIVLDVAIGVAVICLVLLLCVILLSYKSDGNVNLVKRNNTLNRSNLSSTPKTYNNTTIYNKEYEEIDIGPWKKWAGCGILSVNEDECEIAAASLGYHNEMNKIDVRHAPYGCLVGHPTDGWTNTYFNENKHGQTWRNIDHKSICRKASVSNSSMHRLQIKEIIAKHSTNFYTSSANGGIGHGYPWVRIDMVNISIVQRVVITNRKNCCGTRLRNL